jgi:hypothetical protein
MGVHFHHLLHLPCIIPSRLSYIPHWSLICQTFNSLDTWEAKHLPLHNVNSLSSSPPVIWITWWFILTGHLFKDQLGVPLCVKTRRSYTYSTALVVCILLIFTPSAKLFCWFSNNLDNVTFFAQTP